MGAFFTVLIKAQLIVHFTLISRPDGAAFPGHSQKLCKQALRVALCIYVFYDWERTVCQKKTTTSRKIYVSSFLINFFGFPRVDGDLLEWWSSLSWPSGELKGCVASKSILLYSMLWVMSKSLLSISSNYSVRLVACAVSKKSSFQKCDHKHRALATSIPLCAFS